MRPFLSLCMIVKNEEKVLERCLESVHHVVDEIIIVDTGSSDATKEIASKYTKHIYDYDWNGSFSKARNFAQEYASGVWILALDADEYVDSENLKNTIQNLKEITDSKSHIDALSVKIINFTGSYGENIVQHHHARIYINDGTVKYFRDIHEQLEKTNGNVIRDMISPLVVYHSGYLNYVVKNKEKNKRNTALIEAEIKKSGESGFDYFNLGNEYQSMGKIEEALDAYKKAFIRKPDIRYSWVPYTVIQIINCLINLKRYQEALGVIADAEQMYSRTPDFKCLKSNIYITQNRYEDAKEILIEVNSNKDNYDKCILSEDYLELIPHKLLGNIYEREEEYGSAMAHYSQALSYNTTNIEIITRIIYILSRYNDRNDLMNFIANQKWTTNQEITKTIIKVLINNNCVDLARSLSKFIPSKVDMTGINIKFLLVTGNFNDAYNELKDKSIQDLNDLLNQKWIDFYDLLILGLICKETNLLKLFYKLITNSDERLFLSFLLEGSTEKILDKPLYLVSLMEKSILLNQFELFESLIPLRKFYDQSINLLIGHMLYRLHFREVAIAFYQEIEDLENFDDEAFVNTINEFIYKDEIDDAFQFALLGISQNRDNFRIFKNGIELADRKVFPQIKEDLIKVALEHYPDSNWLKSYLCNNEEGIIELNSPLSISELDNKWLESKLQYVKGMQKQELELKKYRKDNIHIVYVMNHVRVCGGVKIIFEQTNRLKKLGIEVSIVSHSPKPNWFLIESNYIEVPVNRDLVSGVPNCDVIIATYWDQIQACIDTSIAPVIYFEQGDFHLFEDEYQSLTSNTINTQLKDFIFNQYQLPEFIITVSRQAARIIREKFHRKAVVIHNAIDTLTFNCKESSESNGSEQYILMMGSDQTAFKGLSEILEAYSIIKREVEEIKLYWITPNPPSREYAQFVHKIFVSPSQLKIAELFKNAALYVSASHYESFSLPVLEAMACGCPVVTSENNGVLEYVRDNINALTTKIGDPKDIADKVLSILKDPELEKQLISNGLSTAKQFDWDNTISQLIKLFRKVASYEVKKSTKSGVQREEVENVMYGTYIGNNKMLVKTVWGGHLIVSASDLSISPILITSGIFEAPLTKFLLNRIKNGDVVFDIGANIGYFTTLLGMLVGNNGRVIAYEPDPLMFKFLLDNTGTNYLHNQVELNNKAIYSSETELTLHVSSKYSGHSSIYNRDNDELKKFDEQFDVNVNDIKVNAENLDKFLGVYSKINLIKIDIEGGEYGAFLGMTGLLENGIVDTIVFEWNQQALGVQVDAFVQLLEDISKKSGMLFYFLDNEGNPVTTSLNQIMSVDFIHSVLLSKPI